MMERLDTAAGLLRLLLPGRTTIVDVGAGHGRFSKLAADIGWRVTATDARRERWPGDRRIEFVQCDCLEFGYHGLDAVLCLGLWYHLPVLDQIRLLRRWRGKPVILDTHFVSDADAVDVGHGLRGRLRREPGLLTSGHGHGRDVGCWPTLHSLRHAAHVHAFRVWEHTPHTIDGRTFFLLTPQT